MPGARKLRSTPKKQIVVTIPAPLSGRLDALVALADEDGTPTARNEILSALIASPWEPDDLAELVREYRSATVRRALVPGQDQALVLKPTKRPRQRRFLEDDTTLGNEWVIAEVDPGETLQGAATHRIAPKIPGLLDTRLESLVKQVPPSGAPTSRREVVAALILGAPDTPEPLFELLRRYRRQPASTGQVLRRPRGRPRRTP
jgi:hypothetical protein